MALLHHCVLLVSPAGRVVLDDELLLPAAGSFSSVPGLHNEHQDGDSRQDSEPEQHMVSLAVFEHFERCGMALLRVPEVPNRSGELQWLLKLE